jgi:hypothetical protein
VRPRTELWDVQVVLSNADAPSRSRRLDRAAVTIDPITVTLTPPVVAVLIIWVVVISGESYVTAHVTVPTRTAAVAAIPGTTRRPNAHLLMIALDDTHTLDSDAEPPSRNTALARLCTKLCPTIVVLVAPVAATFDRAIVLRDGSLYDSADVKLPTKPTVATTPKRRSNRPVATRT